MGGFHLLAKRFDSVSHPVNGTPSLKKDTTFMSSKFTSCRSLSNSSIFLFTVEAYGAKICCRWASRWRVRHLSTRLWPALSSWSKGVPCRTGGDALGLSPRPERTHHRSSANEAFHIKGPHDETQCPSSGDCHSGTGIRLLQLDSLFILRQIKERRFATLSQEPDSGLKRTKSQKPFVKNSPIAPLP